MIIVINLELLALVALGLVTSLVPVIRKPVITPTIPNTTLAPTAQVVVAHQLAQTNMGLEV